MATILRSCCHSQETILLSSKQNIITFCFPRSRGNTANHFSPSLGWPPSMMIWSSNHRKVWSQRQSKMKNANQTKFHFNAILIAGALGHCLLLRGSRYRGLVLSSKRKQNITLRPVDESWWICKAIAIMIQLFAGKYKCFHLQEREYNQNSQWHYSTLGQRDAETIVT